MDSGAAAAAAAASSPFPFPLGFRRRRGLVPSAASVAVVVVVVVIVRGGATLRWASWIAMASLRCAVAAETNSGSARRLVDRKSIPEGG